MWQQRARIYNLLSNVSEEVWVEREKNRHQMIRQVGQNVNYRWIWVTYRGFSVLLFLQLFCKFKVIFKKFLKILASLSASKRNSVAPSTPECPFSEGLVDWRKVLHHQKAAFHGQLSWADLRQDSLPWWPIHCRAILSGSYFLLGFTPIHHCFHAYCLLNWPKQHLPQGQHTSTHHRGWVQPTEGPLAIRHMSLVEGNKKGS